MEGNAHGSTTMDVGDSRKRPLDRDSDDLTTKRSNSGTGEVMLKQLIPSHLAGVILGKGGETIVSIQSTTGSLIKMSKGSEYYPGTTDRVCSISGPASCVRKAHDVVWEKIRCRVDTSKIGIEELQVKIVVPNATIGMIIGKGGCYIKQIKDETGAYVQISQKSPDGVLVERVVTIAGSASQISKAFDMVFKVIVDDPQSGSCPCISYSEFKGPVANSNPTGSPFAVGDGGGGGFGYAGSGPGPQMYGGTYMAGGLVAPNSVEALKLTLRNSGFSVQASDEISAAMCTLANYGLLGPSGFGFTGFGFGAGPGQCGLTLDLLTGILNGQRPPPNNPGGGMPKMDRNTAGQFPNGPDMFPPSNAMMNQNSFGLGPGMSAGSSGSSASQTKELEIGENIVGAVLGHGGRAIVEIQRMTATTIQISKKGVFAPGTRNRIATISGPAAGVERAVMLVQQCVQQEETKRSRQEKMLK